MAHIQRRRCKDGSFRWRAVSKIDGQWACSKWRRDKKTAQREGRALDEQLETKGLPKTRKQLKKINVSQVIHDYLHHHGITDDSGNLEEDLDDNQESTGLRLRRMYMSHESAAATELMKISLADIAKKHAEKYRETRLRETWRPPGSKGEARTYTPRTVRKEIGLLKTMFDWYGKEFDISPQTETRLRGLE